MAENKQSFPARPITQDERERAEVSGLGAFYFSRNKMNLWAVLPDRDGTPFWHRFNIGNQDVRPCWNWDGNEQSPTLTPSIHWPGEWHGYLTNGQFKSI